MPGDGNNDRGLGGEWAMTQERRTGRPMAPLSADLDPAVAAFVRLLRAFYADLNLTLTQLEAQLGVDATTLSRYLNGRRIPEIEFLNKLFEIVEERPGGIPVHDDAKRSARNLYYEACAVLDRQRYEVYVLQDKVADAERRAQVAEEEASDLRDEILRLRASRELAERTLRQLESADRREQDAQDELRAAHEDRERLNRRIAELTSQLAEAARDIQTAVFDCEAAQAALRDAEAKFEAEIQRRWEFEDSDFDEAAPAAANREVSPTAPTRSSLFRSGRKQALDEALGEIERLKTQQQRLVTNYQAALVNMAERAHRASTRQIAVIDALERSETDPAILERLYRLDHLAMTAGVAAETVMAFLKPEQPSGKASPMRLTDTVRSAVGRVEGYQRVVLIAEADGLVPESVVRDVVQMVRELTDNAISASPVSSRVEIVADVAAAASGGFGSVEIHDRGIGMAPAQLETANRLLAVPAPPEIALAHRIGLHLVAHLAQRHGMEAKLRASPGGGVTARLAQIPLVPAGAESSRF